MAKTTHISGNEQRLDHIDGLRGFAAMAVVIQHALELLPLKHSRPDLSVAALYFQNYISLGRFGVVLFFFISGFLIPLSLKAPHRPILNFAISRFFRLYPLYWLSLITGILLFPYITTYEVSLFQDVISFTMLQKLFNMKDIYGPYWTLFVELLFYFGCAALCYLGLLFRPVFMWRALVATCAVMVGANILTVTDMFSGGVQKMLLQGTTMAMYLVFMVLGYIIRLFYERRLGGAALMQSSVAVYGLLTVYCIARSINGAYADLLSPTSMMLSSTAAFILFITTLEYKFFTDRISRFLGQISYGTYLFHVQSIAMIIWIAGATPKTFWECVMMILLVVASTIAFAALTYQAVELPGISLGKMIRRRLQSRKA